MLSLEPRLFLVDGYPDALRDMFNSANDFESRGHPLHYFYGLNQFVTFGPSDKEKEDIDNETRSKVNADGLFAGQ